MKRIFAAVLFAICAPALAADYFDGQCYVAATCFVGPPALASGVTTFSDTVMFELGNWTESYGIYEYASSVQVRVYGGRFCAPGRLGQCRYLYVDSASIDGASLTPLGDGIHWSLPISLSPGSHTFAATGHSNGYVPGEHWVGAIDGIVYTLVPFPPPPCTDCGGE